MKFVEKGMKRMKWFDMSLVKISTAAGIIFLFKLIPGGLGWLDSVNIWWFIVIMIIFAIRPINLIFKK
tara:strand:- start:6033 stop:6236 length:204 start_codon:yes stop_codon:yes gene_type:complete